MLRTRRHTRGISGILFLLITLTLWSYACSREDKFIGLYKSEPNGQEGYSDVYLELKKGGEGIRRVQEKSFVFRWDTKGEEMRIYTKSGGIIVGRLEGKTALVVILPGSKIAHFKKIR